MRTWRLPGDAGPCDAEAAPASCKARGLCLMAIEFLTRFPASECVVTSSSLQFWDAVFDLFPKTLFQVFCSPVEDPPRPNVIRHNARFDLDLARKFNARGTPFNLVFTGEGMEAQLETHLEANPAAALLLVTGPASEYLDGELVYPLHCARDSALCGLVPSTGAPRLVAYGARYYEEMRRFQAWAENTCGRYDRDSEDLVLTAYAKSICGLGAVGTAKLLVEMTRNGLPPCHESDVLFWEPPQPQPQPQQPQPQPQQPQPQPQQPQPCLQLQILPNDLELLLMAALEAMPAAEEKKPQNDPNGLVGGAI